MTRNETLAAGTYAAELMVKPSSIDRDGLFARKTIPKGSRVIEYVGEKISKRESQERCQANNEYIFCLDDHFDLDGSVDWNLARLINHSCDPNCAAELIEGRIWIVAQRDVRPGEEITFNYGYDLQDFQEHPCHCGAPNCAGYIIAEELLPNLKKEAANRQKAG